MARAWILAWLVAGACGDDLERQALPTADELYDPTRVWALQIGLSDDALDALRREPREWVRGEVGFEGHVFHDVAIRLKGTFSFQPIGAKPALRLKFGEFVDDATFLGLPSLTLNNLTQDRALVHEAVSYRAFRDLGVPAPRTGYIDLQINGEPYGLYANIEPVNGHFIEQWFEDDDGPLFEAGIGHDLVPEDVVEFEHDEGPDDRAALAELAAWATDPARDVFFDPASPLDREQFFAMTVGEVLTSQWDGYHKPNNYYLYREPSLGTWAFVPSGLDQTWERTLAPFAADSQLLARCFAEAPCLVAFAEHAGAVAASVDGAALQALLDEVSASIDAAPGAAARRRYPLAKYQRHRAEMRAGIDEAIARLAAAGACVEAGAEADRDGDGAGACLDDCDDSSPLARPGGVETCDGLDNDCDGFVDELGSCTCDEVELGDAHYLLCAAGNTWAGASALCTARGGWLASVPSAERNAALFAATQARAPGRWYIGYHDRLTEDVVEWAGGQGTSFVAWPDGEPDDFGEEDCVTLDPFADGGWTDQRCGESHPYVCELAKDEAR
jgi:hypothetical protein